jgi:Spy/CpxP family protein refolding chaperone
MKKSLCAALAAAALLAGARVPRALAQPSDGGGPQADAGGPPSGDEANAPEGSPRGGERRGGDRDMHRMKSRLGLSDDAAAKLEAAIKARREASGPLQKQLREGMRKLGGQLRDKAADADIQATLDSLAAARKGLREQEETFESSVKGFLTATQRAKLLIGQMMMARGGRGGERRGGRDGGRGDHDGPRDRGGDGGSDGPPPSDAQ